MSLRAPAPRVAAPTPTPELAAAAGLIPHIAVAPLGPPPAPPNVQISTLRSDQVATGPTPAAHTCPRCGEVNPEANRFCHSCGFAMSAPPKPAPVAAPATPPAAVVCSRCRGVADPGADFCKFCGARLSAEPPSSPHPAAIPRPEIPRPDLAAPSAMPHTPQLAPQLAPQIDMHAAPQGPTRPLHGIGDPIVRARLVRIAKDGSEGAQHPITAELTDIGRTEGNILLADDPYLSPRHARITLRANGDPNAPPALVLVDLGSVNGVFVRLRSPHPLAHGDLLLLGQQVLRFEAVTELEGARGPAMQHGVLLFGSPAPASRARLLQRTVEGLVRDVLYVVRDELVLGRESGDRAYPEDVFMSRRHAAVRREGSGYQLHDLGSSNGTFVQIHGEHVLRDGDQFRIGHHLFRVDVPALGAA